MSFPRRRLAAVLLGLAVVLAVPQVASAQAIDDDDIEVDAHLPGSSDPAPSSPQSALFLLGGAAALAVLARRATPHRGFGNGVPAGDDLGGGPVLDLTDRVAVPAGV